LHAFSGCDTTSALFNQGKMKFINVLRKNPDLNEIIQVFKNSNADPEIIAKGGERVLLELYSYSNVKSKKSMSLNNYRYACFTTSAFKSKFNIAWLPPTEAAAQPITRFSSGMVWESTKCRAMGMEKKQERANFCHHTRAPSSGKLVKTYFLQMQKEMSKSLWMQKGDTTIKKRAAYSTSRWCRNECFGQDAC
jgi:hypothetical protein